jgi:hypothetical protein
MRPIFDAGPPASIAFATAPTLMDTGAPAKVVSRRRVSTASPWLRIIPLSRYK